MITLKAIKKNSLDNYGDVDPVKRGKLLKNRYNALLNKAMATGKDLTIKFHGVGAWSFASPCHLILKATGVVTLKSYATDVANYFPSKDVVLVNGWYSNTTAGHVDEFRRVFTGKTCSDAVESKCWQTSAKNGVALSNLQALGLGKVLKMLDRVKGVYSYQYYQMGEVLTYLVRSYYGTARAALGSDPVDIANNACGLMNSRTLQHFMATEPLRCDNRRNLDNSWWRVFNVLQDYMIKEDRHELQKLCGGECEKLAALTDYVNNRDDLTGLDKKLQAIVKDLDSNGFGNASEDAGAARYYTNDRSAVVDALDLAAYDVACTYSNRTDDNRAQVYAKQLLAKEGK